MNKQIENYLFSDIYEVPEEYSKKTAICFEKKKYSYEELSKSVDYFANALLKMGVKKDDHVAILSMNSFNWIAAFYAVIKIGAIAVLINYISRHNDIVKTIKFTDCKFLFPHHNIDWSRTVGNEGQQLREETMRGYLLAHNFEIIYPEEEQVLTLDINNYLKFYNLKASFFENYYTETDDAGQPQSYTNYNNFSMVIELNTCYKSILFTGDINYLAENNIASEIVKIDAIQLPHHGLNRYSNQEFIRKCYKAIGIISSNSSVSLMRPLQKIIANTGTLINLTINGNTILDIFDNNLVYKTSNHTTISPNVKVIEEDLDLNTLLLEGTYIVNNENLTITNGAPNYNNQFMLEVKAITQTIVYQFMYTFNSDPIIWCRKNAPAGWTPWRLINVKEYGVLIATMSASHTITSTSNEKLPFDTTKTSLVYGNAITFDTTNNQIKVGKGVNFIRVDLKLMMSSVQPNDRLSFCILKNNNVYQRTDTYAKVGANESFEVSSIVQVAENDIITVSARNISSARGSVDNANYLTTMQVEII